MRDQLIGYLLNAVEPDERSLVEQRLLQDESLRQELEVLRTSLHPLAVDGSHLEAPKGLAQRCCEYVYSRTEIMPAALTPGSTVAGGRSRWSWLDMAVAGAIATAAAVLLVPAIYQSHLSSQQLKCQNNLQTVGAALASFSDRHDGYYPAVSPEKPLDAAALVSQGYLPGSAVVCPSKPEDGKATDESLVKQPFQVMPKDQLEKLISRVGSYGYTLGYQNGDKPALQQNKHRKDFALSSDLPGSGSTNSPNHGGNGQNVLFEDGHVKYLDSPKNEATGDDIFRNNKGEVAPGLNADDSVIVHPQDQSK